VNLSGFQFAGVDHQVETVVLPLKRALEARGEQLHINLCYVDFQSNAAAGATAQGNLSHARNPAEFSEYVLVYFQHLRDKYGLTPDSFELILEPENTSEWRGETIGRALVVTVDRLRQEGFTPEILAPSNTAMASAIAYFDEMIQIPGVLGRLNTFVYHRYGRQRTADVAVIRERAAEHGLKTAMLERVNAGIDALLEDLTVGNVSSWQQWGAAGRSRDTDDGSHYALVGTDVAGSPVIALARQSNQLANVFLYVRRGAVRISSRSTRRDLTSVAFINRDGTWIVVVRATGAEDWLTIKGLPAGQYGLRVTSDSGARRDPDPITVSAAGVLSTAILEPGVITVYGLQ
jgi:hypothetical protein